MIHLVSERNAHLYGEEIAGLHRARRAVFVDELGWKLRVRDGMEFDEYDDARAGNIIGFSADREVVMGLRFRPTDDCSMLLDHFSHVLPAGIRPIDDGRTWELSRGFCIERGVRRQQLRRKAACMIAPLELAYAAGIDRCVGFTDVRMLSFCYGVGWKMSLLGEPAHYGEGDAVAYEVDVSRASLDDMRQMWGLPQPSFIEIEALAAGEATVHDAGAHRVNETPELEKITAPVDAVRAAPPLSASADHYYDAFELHQDKAGDR